MTAASNESLTTVPNLLTLSRIPLTLVLCACIGEEAWLAALIVFAIAALTDAVDGWWARRFGLLSAFGRTFDPLTDKILLGGGFIFLIPVPEAGLMPWMVALILGREMLVTGIRGYVESLGQKFGADWFGKLKTILQCVCLFVILANQTWRQVAQSSFPNWLELCQVVTIYAMVLATAGSGVQYCIKAWILLGSKAPSR